MRRTNFNVRVPGFLLAACFLAAGCDSMDRKHGYVPEEQDLEQLVVGVDTRESIMELVGRPISDGMIEESSWYYVESRFRDRGIGRRKETGRAVVALSFGEDGTLANVERFGLEDGQVVVLSRRVTGGGIADVGFLQQLFGSVGNFAAEQFVN